MQASDSREIEAAFRALVRNRADALLVGADPFILSRRLLIATLAARHALPAVYTQREFVDAGGLLSYGASTTEAYRQGGIYTGKVLKGAKPADLPVMRSTKFELVINLATARAIEQPRSRSTRSTQPARSLLTEEHCSSGNTVLSRRSFETSIPQNESIFVSLPC